jgi:multiple sugar transport system ATP-binding protein
VRFVEHHGHESLAFVDVGATGVSPDDYGPPAGRVAGNGRPGRIAGMFRRRAAEEGASNGANGSGTNGNGSGDGTNGHAAGPAELQGRHGKPPAELAVRLQPYPSLRVGEPLSIGVRLDALHFFDPRGIRIDVGWR